MTPPTCREVARAIAADEMVGCDDVRRATLNAHLSHCPPCAAFGRQLELTAEAVRAACDAWCLEAPADFEEQLVRCLCELP
jgi:hypothetical protein